jgi:predicted NACHT family NTPase
MAKRSLQASDQGIKKVKQAFRRKGWTQEYLAGEVGLETRQLIWKFFTGKPIDRQVFHDIYLILGLDPVEIAQQPITEDIFCHRFLALSLALELEYLLDNELYLQELLQDLKNQLPSPNQGRQALKIWWQTNAQTWIEELRSLMMSYRRIGYNWQFNREEWQDLQNYWAVNKLLIDCLNSASNLTSSLRDSIKESLFLVKAS